MVLRWFRGYLTSRDDLCAMVVRDEARYWERYAPPQWSKWKKAGGKLSACRGEGSATRLQLRLRFVLAAMMAVLRTALALQCVSKARDWTGHVVR
jgi:hypothetical protein